MNAGLRSYTFSCTFIAHYVFSRFVLAKYDSRLDRSLVFVCLYLSVSGIFTHSKRKDGALVIARVTAKA